MRRPNVFSQIDVVAFRNRAFRPKLLRKISASCKSRPKAKLQRRYSNVEKRAPVVRVPEYSVWLGMIGRCSPTSGHKDYGGRGIRVCEEWRTSFDAFLAYVGPRPSDLYSIGRKNNNGNYEPGNVQWENSDQQQNNRRNTLRVPLCGEVISATQYSRITGISYRRISAMAWLDRVDDPAPRKPREEDNPVFVKVNIPLSVEDAFSYAPCDSFEIFMENSHV